MKQLISQLDSRVVEQLAALTDMSSGTTVVQETIAGVTVYRATPSGISANDRRVYLDFHGGALIFLGGVAVGLLANETAQRIGATVVSVDYRMPPDFPYPAALDDGVAVYRGLLEVYEPRQIVVGGASAGGNLATATVLRARDEGLPMPAGVVLFSRESDLTEFGDSFETLMGLDPDTTHRLMPANLLYAAGDSLSHPYASPLFLDYTKGFPPSFLQSGTRDLFLSNTARLHRAMRDAHVAAALHVFEAMPHAGFGAAPEAVALTPEVRRFVAAAWAGE